MPRKLKAHVIVDRWTEGGFHTVRFVKCRCGEVFHHYNAGEVKAMFAVHQAEREGAGEK